MDIKDMMAVGAALVIVLFLAIGIKPMLTSSETILMPVIRTDNQAVFSSPTPVPPSFNPTPEITPPYSVPEWNGTVTILSFNDSNKSAINPPTSTPLYGTDSVDLTPSPTPRQFLGSSSVHGAEGVIPPHKPSIPEGATRIPPMNFSPQVNATLVFDETYTLRYTTVGLLVDVVKPPFILQFNTIPTTSDPYLKNNPHYCFLTLTIRDALTREIVAEEGYGRMYGTESKKSIIIYRSGEYHITLYGNMVQVRVTVLTR